MKKKTVIISLIVVILIGIEFIFLTIKSRSNANEIDKANKFIEETQVTITPNITKDSNLGDEEEFDRAATPTVKPTQTNEEDEVSPTPHKTQSEEDKARIEAWKEQQRILNEIRNSVSDDESEFIFSYFLPTEYTQEYSLAVNPYTELALKSSSYYIRNSVSYYYYLLNFSKYLTEEMKEFMEKKYRRYWIDNFMYSYFIDEENFAENEYPFYDSNLTLVGQGTFDEMLMHWDETAVYPEYEVVAISESDTDYTYGIKLDGELISVVSITFDEFMKVSGIYEEKRLPEEN